MGIYDTIAKTAIKAAESPTAKKIGNYLAESSAGKETGKALGDYLAKSSAGKETGKALGNYLAESSAGEEAGKALGSSMSKLSKPVSIPGESMGLAGAGYVVGRSDNNTKDFSDSTNYDAMGNVSGMKIGGQTHIEEAKKRAEQSRMDDYHMEQTEKAIAGVSPQDYDLAQSQPMKTGSYKEGGNIHIHKGHDYIKDLL